MKQILRRFLMAMPLSGLACSGLDPQSFGPGGGTPGVAAQAGYSFDAGPLEPDAPGGSGGASSSTQANAGRGSSAGTSGSDRVGDGGESDDASGGTTTDVEAGSGNDPDHPAGGANGGVAGTPPDLPGGGGDGGERGGGGGRDASGGGAGTQSGGVGGAPGGSGNTAGHGGSNAGEGGTDGGVGRSGAGSAGSAGATARTLRFGEYVEGSASYKALELVGAPGSALDGCRVVTYSNGASTGSGTALTGAISTSGAYTLCSSTLAAVLEAVCDRTTNLSMNGNDAVVLECDGEIMDGIGQIGFDPGTAWLGASGSTANATLRFRCGTEPDREPTDAFEPDTRWLALPIDTFEGLGDPSCG